MYDHYFHHDHYDHHEPYYHHDFVSPWWLSSRSSTVHHGYDHYDHYHHDHYHVQHDYLQSEQFWIANSGSFALLIRNVCYVASTVNVDLIARNNVTSNMTLDQSNKYISLSILCRIVNLEMAIVVDQPVNVALTACNKVTSNMTLDQSNKYISLSILSNRQTRNCYCRGSTCQSGSSCL